MTSENLGLYFLWNILQLSFEVEHQLVVKPEGSLVDEYNKNIQI